MGDGPSDARKVELSVGNEHQRATGIADGKLGFVGGGRVAEGSIAREIADGDQRIATRRPVTDARNEGLDAVCADRVGEGLARPVRWAGRDTGQEGIRPRDAGGCEVAARDGDRDARVALDRGGECAGEVADPEVGACNLLASGNGAAERGRSGIVARVEGHRAPDTRVEMGGGYENVGAEQGGPCSRIGATDARPILAGGDEGRMVCKAIVRGRARAGDDESCLCW